MPAEFPIAAAPTPISTASASSPSTGADIAEDTQNFMSTLSQLLDEGAVVVPAPPQAAIQAIAADQDRIDDDVLGAASLDESLLALLLPSQTPAASAAAGDANVIDAGGRAAADSLPMLAANAALLQKAAGKGNADAKVAIEFQATLSAEAADALLNGGDNAGSDDAASSLTATDTTGRATAGLTLHTTAQGARAQLTIDSRVGTPAWTDDLAAKATFINERGMQSASLRLSPEHLGPMEIQISVQDDKASVWFGAAHAETRAALEQALPRLRELLSSQGLSLSDAGVFREPPRDQSRAYAATHSNGVAPENETREVVVSRRNVLLDAYA